MNKELAYYKGPSEIVNATPQDFFDALNKEFKFTLDPCANKQNHKCKRWFGPESPHGTDGLAESWQGHNVFCNPPYARGEIYKWVKKCYEESLDKETLVVALIRSATDTKYFHDFILGKARLVFPKGRLRFNNAKGPAPFPSLLVIWGEQKLSEHVTLYVSKGFGETEFEQVLTKHELELDTCKATDNATVHGDGDGHLYGQEIIFQFVLTPEQADALKIMGEMFFPKDINIDWEIHND